jgi:NADH pyrophosphatase NudC (nudix superfamily)
MQELIDTLAAKFPKLRFTPGQQFYWSPETGEIFYEAKARGKQATWSLLHETGHALSGHISYQADFELLRLEIDAWERARQIAAELGVTIDEDHIQNSLDTYRDWLHKRSICPSCGTKCLQQGDFVHYRCFNCHIVWKVTASRFCRAYRRRKDVPQPASLHLATDL